MEGPQRSDERPLLAEISIETETDDHGNVSVFEVGSDGKRRPARPEIQNGFDVFEKLQKHFEGPTAPKLFPEPIGRSRGGRPPSIQEINGELVRKLRGEATQKQFVRNLKISTDVLQMAENKNLATQRTLQEIARSASAKSAKLGVKDFLKNQPGKAEET